MRDPGNQTQDTTSWWVLRKGQRRKGPYSLEQLQSYLSAVSSRQGLFLRKDGVDSWVSWELAAVTFPELHEMGVLQMSRKELRAAFLHAVKTGRTEVVTRLVKAGANANDGTPQLWPMLCAIRAGNLYMVCTLFDLGAASDSDDVYEAQLSEAASLGRLDIIKIIHEREGIYSAPAALKIGMEEGYAACTEYLLKAGLHPESVTLLSKTAPSEKCYLRAQRVAGSE